MADDHTSTISELIKSRYSDLTRKERKFSDHLMANYPVAGLASITEVAEKAKVSTPTVLRTAKKLGFSGFPGFQSALRNELEQILSNPIVKHEKWAQEAPAEHILNQFATAAMDNLSTSLQHIDHHQFDKVGKTLANKEKKVAIVGGRLSHSLADYFATHLQMIRRDVTLLSASPSRWPHDLLNMGEGDVLVLFDVRRYENNLFDLAKLATKRGLVLILFTDQWMSPISSLAKHSIASRISVPSGWDSAVVTLFMLEALLADIQTHHWPQTRDRLKNLEKIFDATKRFMKNP